MTAPRAVIPSRPGQSLYARRWVRGSGLALSLVLAACQAPAPPPIPPVAAAPSEATPNDAAPDPATAALPPTPVINDDPQQLMGIEPGALGAILGEPELIRREAPAEIWQYRNDACVLDVFLYDTAGRREVTYIEARDGTAQRMDIRACLNTLLRARLVRPLG